MSENENKNENKNKNKINIAADEISRYEEVFDFGLHLESSLIFCVSLLSQQS